jgi:two-component system, chemotaxis family, chemotaxis protein CheY
MSRVLAVDDSVTMRQMVSYCLREAGYEVVEAVDGADALAKLQANKVDLVITDLYMPHVDGIELIKRVRTLANYRFTPILMLTTETQGGRKAEGQAAGATGWIVKPFEPQQLIKVVRRVIA